MSNISGVLTADNPVSEEFEIPSCSAVLIVGEGAVSIQRSFMGSDFYALSDGSGSEVVFYGSAPHDVMFNADISNPCRKAKFRIEADTKTKVKFYISSGG